MTTKRQQLQNLTARIRREIKQSLQDAIQNKAERGTVVTTDGKWFAFQVTYATRKCGEVVPTITTNIPGGWRTFNAADAASQALYLWGYTSR